MMGEVIDLQIATRCDIEPAKVLEKASEAELAEVVVIGFRKDGRWYFASSLADAGDVMFHLNRANHKLNTILDEADER